MEMGGRRMRCTYCGLQIMVPYSAHTIQCPLRKTIVHVKPNDPLSHAHSSICHAASRLKDLFESASTNVNMMGASGFSGPGASGFGYYPRPARPLVPVSAHGRKRAVLCGVSYYGQTYRLKGTVNDVKCMRYFLVHKLAFPNESIFVLTEEEPNPYLIPTKNNIRKALQWLVQGCQSGDSLVFFFSGHGSQQPDFNRDEVDGYDEMLWPVDHMSEGKILDDEINATIVRPLPRGAKLHALIDACHSGTVLDLPFVCRMNRDGCYMWEDHGRVSATYTGTSGGFAVSISACDDHQTSVDTTALSGNTATGAMTFSFIQAVQNEPGLTYGHLINSMRRTLRETKTGFLSSLVKKVLLPKLSQEPQLSSSEKFDIYSTRFAL